MCAFPTKLTIAVDCRSFAWRESALPATHGIAVAKDYPEKQGLTQRTRRGNAVSQACEAFGICTAQFSPNEQASQSNWCDRMSVGSDGGAE